MVERAVDADLNTPATAEPAASAQAPQSRNPFRAAGFSTWWLGSLLAGTGIGIQTVTVPLYIRDRVDLESRALAISAALVVQTLPGALLALLGGTLADRVERSRILVRTYGIAAAISLAYVALSGLDVRAIWPIFPLAALVGCAGAFTNPARQSMLPQLVTQPQLQNGVIFGNMGYIATFQFLGPMVAGLIVDARGLTTGFGLEVALLAGAALVFMRLSTPTPEPSGASVLADLAEGLRYVRARPALTGLLGLGTAIGVFFIGPFGVTVPILVPDVFHASDKWVGILWGSFGAGVFAGSLALTFVRVPRRGLAVSLTIFVGGAIEILYGSTETLWLAVALQLATGLNASLFINYVIALLQENTEPRMMGRVMSMYSLAFFASMPIGYAQSGAVTSAFGPQASLIGSGAVAVAVGLACVALLRSVRRLE